MKTLIAYYSFTENNEKLAKHLQKQLNCDLIKIDTVKKRNGFSILLDLIFKRRPKLKPIDYYLIGYDHVILVAPIWAGKIATPMMSFLIQERLNIKQYSFITLCGGRAGQKEKIYSELWNVLKKPPVGLIELWINDLLPASQKDSVKHTSAFRIGPNDFEKFDSQLRNFIKEESLIEAI